MQHPVSTGFGGPCFVALGACDFRARTRALAYRGNRMGCLHSGCFRSLSNILRNGSWKNKHGSFFSSPHRSFFHHCGHICTDRTEDFIKCYAMNTPWQGRGDEPTNRRYTIFLIWRKRTITVYIMNHVIYYTYRYKSREMPRTEGVGEGRRGGATKGA